MNVLALQLKRIGDLVLTTPALHAMKAAGARVTLVVTDGTAALLPALTESVDEALVYQTRRGGNWPLWRRLWRGGKFDACVDFTGRDRSALMAWLSGAPKRVIAAQSLRRRRWRRPIYNAPIDSAVRGRHTVDLYLDHLSALTFPNPPPRLENAAPILQIPPAEVARADEALGAAGIDAREPFIVIHPGSARAEKYWLPERWAAVMRACRMRFNRRCVLTGGVDPFEAAHLAQVRSALNPDEPYVDLSGRLDLLTLAAVLARAALVVTTDSGPMHLAAAFQRPQIALFGPTNPFHWRPRHAGAMIVQAGQNEEPVREFSGDAPAGPMNAISTESVIACIKQVPL